jgi:uncharacterized membrane protein YdjX (TVP38/TMEM64 family)
VVIRHVGAPALGGALDLISSLGPWGPLLFALLYVAAAVLLLPGLILTLGAGFVFGLPRGVAIVSISATLAATVAFTVGRYLARDWVERTLGSNPRIRAIDDAVAREGWKIVLLTRLSPVFPFSLLNYAFGLTKVRLGHYVLASWVGMLPATVLYVYLGSIAGALAGAAAASPRTPAQWALYAVGLAATVAVTLYVTRLARAALRSRAPLDAGASP